jgi:regulator of replication initiation timing
LSKPSRGKTETIKQRALYVYLPTLEMVEDWKQRAEKDKKSLSNWIMLKVLDSIGFEEGSAQREQMQKELEETKRQKEDVLEENEKLRQENRMLRMLSDNLDKELKRLRTQPFVEAGFVGERRFDKDLLELLRKGHGVDKEMVFARLHIKPSDVEAIDGVRKQLEALQAYGLVEYDGRWWKWKG